ncbi:MAG: hypothetical protein U0R19_31680 [Bryobacteraceae bacterium]
MVPCTANASPAVILSDAMEVMQQAAELAEQGKVGSAIDLLEQTLAMGEESAELCIYLAKLCHSINELRAFANWCHEAMRIDPSNAEPHFLLGKELHRMARWEEAEETLAVALSMPRLAAAERAEAQLLHAEAAAKHADYRTANPGFSNL